MTAFTYKIIERDAYLTAIAKGRSDSLEIRISDAAPALIHIGGITVKAEDGVGRVKLSTLSDGIFTPEIIFKDKTVALYPIRHTTGKISLACPEDICAALGARAYDVQKRVSEIEEELHRLKKAVWGEAIF